MTSAMMKLISYLSLPCVMAFTTLAKSDSMMIKQALTPLWSESKSLCTRPRLRFGRRVGASEKDLPRGKQNFPPFVLKKKTSLHSISLYIYSGFRVWMKVKRRARHPCLVSKFKLIEMSDAATRRNVKCFRRLCSVLCTLKHFSISCRVLFQKEK